MSFQATQFRCGGFALGTVVNHGLMDGFALEQFAKNLTHVVRKGDLAFLPVIDRTCLKARIPLEIKFEHEELMKHSELGIDSSPLMLRKMSLLRNKVAFHNQSEKHVFKLFTLSGKMLGLLKLKAKQEGVTHCSNFMAAVAHLWRARTAAMVNINGNDITRVHYVVDMRSRMRPRLPREYAGNAVKAAYAKASAKELLEQPFSAIVKKLEEAGNRLTDEYMRSAIDWLELHDGVMRMENGFVVTSWSRMQYGDVELSGLIKSIYAGPVVSGRADIVVFMADEKDKGGIKVHLGLDPSDMARFQMLIQIVDIDTSIRV